MKKWILTLAFTVCMHSLFTQKFTPVDNGSVVKFSIKNFGLNVSGTFKGLKGTVLFDPANLAAATINASVDVSTINTGNNSRDNHLKKEEYFDAPKYAMIGFSSVKITNSAKPNSFFMEGKITIKGVTKKVSFPFTATPKADGYLFEGTFKLNRRDFAVGGNSLVMSDNLIVFLSVFSK
ncbi:MAG: YceI family protein [Ferruginibacter sp.]